MKSFLRRIPTVQLIHRVVAERITGSRSQLEPCVPNQTELVICDQTIDVTYIPTAEGWLYLAVVLDLYSRLVVGWAMGAQNDRALIRSALDMALERRQPAAGLLHHSDQGSPYTSAEYRSLLAAHDLEESMSRVGNCYDNAVVESFFATLKAEGAAQPFATRAAARSAIFEYIEGWYNRVRLHSTLGYVSPLQFERISGH